MSRVIALSGGIGSGKSVVARMLRALGVPVYDCDLRARAIMEQDLLIQQALVSEVTPEAVDCNGAICRPAIARVVFANPDRLAALNRIVHGAVRADLSKWLERNALLPVVAFESAIIRESSLDALGSVKPEVWEVTAPEQVRMKRLIDARGMNPDDARARMAAQSPYPNPAATIINAPDTPLLPQLLALLR